MIFSLSRVGGPARICHDRPATLMRGFQTCLMFSVYRFFGWHQDMVHLILVLIIYYTCGIDISVFIFVNSKDSWSYSTIWTFPFGEDFRTSISLLFFWERNALSHGMFTPWCFFLMTSCIVAGLCHLHVGRGSRLSPALQWPLQTNPWTRWHVMWLVSVLVKNLMQTAEMILRIPSRSLT